LLRYQAFLLVLNCIANSNIAATTTLKLFWQGAAVFECSSISQYSLLNCKSFLVAWRLELADQCQILAKNGAHAFSWRDCNLQVTAAD
jgi:hypothetical protein